MLELNPDAAATNRCTLSGVGFVDSNFHHKEGSVTVARAQGSAGRLWRRRPHRLTVIACALWLVSPTLLCAQQDADSPPLPLEEWAKATQTGHPRSWAAALEAISHASHVPAAVVNQLLVLLSDRSPEVRRRAVVAIGAAGPEAGFAARSVATLLQDPDGIVRGEAAYTLGAIDNLGEPDVLRAVYRAAVQDSANRLRNRLEAVLDQFSGGPISISAEYGSELRNGLSNSQSITRRWAVLTTSLTDAPWAAEELSRLLADGDPGVRRAAMFGLAGLRPLAIGARESIERLRFDSVSRVRDGVRDAIGMLKTGRRAPLVCSHRGTPAATPLLVAVDPSSESLRDDGLGPYRHGVDRVRTFRSFAFNLFLSRAPNSPSGPLDTAAFTSRALLFDLSRPVLASGASPVETIRDSAAVVHFHWMWDPGRRVAWTFDEIPVGGRGASDRVQFEFAVDGRPHILQFGPWAQGDCGEPYAFGAKLDGNGTSRVQIERLGVDDYRLWAPSGSFARLWDYTEPQRPRDRGLYSFSFSLRLARTEGKTL
jgi:hypothetical protein